MDETTTNDDGVTTIRCDFIRGRNVLLTHGDLRPLFERWHRHQDENRIALEPAHAAMFEEALAAFALHLAGRSRNQYVSWTVNIGRPAVNLFLGGDTYAGAIAGRVFTENVAAFDSGQFYQENIVAGKGPFRSQATFPSGAGILDAVEEYYAQSEQRPAKIFDLGECRFAMAHAHPDYDEGWFTGLTADTVLRISETEELGHIETRRLGWQCGCEDPSKISGVLLPSYRKDPEALFDGAETIEVLCPRCAARHVVSRERMKNFADYEDRKNSGGK